MMVFFVAPLMASSVDFALYRLTDQMGAYSWDKSDWQLEGNAKFVTQTWNKIQASGCCGVKGPRDWDVFRPANLDPDVYPSSCCHLGQSLRTTCRKSDVYFHQPGCDVWFRFIASLVSVVFYLDAIIGLAYALLAWRLSIAFKKKTSDKSAIGSAYQIYHS